MVSFFAGKWEDSRSTTNPDRSTNQLCTLLFPLSQSIGAPAIFTLQLKEKVMSAVKTLTGTIMSVDDSRMMIQDAAGDTYDVSISTTHLNIVASTGQSMILEKIDLVNLDPDVLKDSDGDAINPSSAYKIRFADGSDLGVWSGVKFAVNLEGEPYLAHGMMNGWKGALAISADILPVNPFEMNTAILALIPAAIWTQPYISERA
ncbi:hypothetical protein H0H81_005186 [Sphagnurus paluster]|uniref:Uncharacterized protein n=1 Tax=Sphagnurus paluster TaxID=117069 RepID=A0A9P7GS15_9AGAR|nr:hypothetical protein H0H81_005186 [Sphagnurus paluster]